MVTVTQWFNSYESPAREGWYDVKVVRGSHIPQPSQNCWWDGNYFRFGPHAEHRQFYLEPGDKWRGLADKPT